MRYITREVGTHFTKAEWIAACEAAEALWVQDGSDPDDASVYLNDGDDLDVPESVTIRLPNGAKVTSRSIEAFATGGDPAIAYCTYFDCTAIRRALRSPRFDYETNRYVPLG